VHLTYPAFRTIVDDQCAQGAHRGYLMQHHGWFYEVDTGIVLAHRAHADEFLPL
jgi:hypothetical protein